ncbi:hypothetical protein AMECASPLE_005338 [Ameca splendens]|uniref:Uncharacterized protein n=1 Tax=Ameca splendens TaxID=208324 RepID=A0ABV0YL70_9TELE
MCYCTPVMNQAHLEKYLGWLPVLQCLIANLSPCVSLYSLTFSSCLLLGKGFPVLTSGLHCSISGPQTSSHLPPNENSWIISSRAGNLKAPHFPFLCTTCSPSDTQVKILQRSLFLLRTSPSHTHSDLIPADPAHSSSIIFCSHQYACIHPLSHLSDHFAPAHIFCLPQRSCSPFPQ